MWTRVFWVDAAERAIRTFAQVLLAVYGVDTASNELAATWQGTVSAALIAAGVSVLMSIVASGTGNKQTAALVNPTDGGRGLR